ncbi:metalloprotease ImpA [Pseudomonas aeruginosa]|uniref:ImpA family metalloprotease n=1 Tax=Pseudomonas aeruginosa TaxID=287 RepID=UPI000939E25A|nr:ImpA family metalloprotease [Pseudomonas aeruginosa]MDF5800807.1 metalloprotease ImpA [Pseudomonas aeruginosa]MDF5808052.1 metalloprotease ImpA [Pseudomonas aeruginosa]MDF5888673.1 metalloprotease ImpA [Pseudomonas aeruginosa]MDF5915489.1 metalloprotease ImpA [Pseudomonas aeruginosa]
MSLSTTAFPSLQGENMSRSPIPRHRALLAGFCLAGALSAQAATQEEILDAALVSGDSSQLTDSHLVALRLQQQVERIRQTRTQLLDGLYQNLSQAYDPGAASMWVLPANPDNTLPFLIGDKGRVLASLSLEAGGRGLAYGTNVLTQLSGANAAHAPLLKRAVQWLVNGDPGAATAKDFKVSVVGVDKTATLNGLKSAGLQPADAACNALTDASCASASKLLVLGNGASAASLSATVRARLQAGLPILFVHTNGWNQSSTGQQILSGLGLQEGPYGGNYWDKDAVPSSRTRARSVELGGAYGQDPALVQQIVDGSWRTDYDWSKCTSYVGRTTCDDVPGLSDFSKRVDVLKGALDAYNQKAQNLFALPGTTSLRLWLLWADAVRQNIRYPMDKAADTARFQETFVADAIVGYVREAGAAQKELGSYAGQRQQSMPVSGSEETLTLTLPSAQGFTAIGRMAAPGKRLSIRIEDAGQASLAVGLNTQRIGSTRLWNTRQYDRPRFLKSPDIKLQANQSVALVSPYGGLLQLDYSGATPGQTVTVKVTGAASQPFLDIQPGEDSSQAIADFIQALDADKADWLEIRSGSVEVHAKVEKVRGSIDKDYGGDVQRFIRELNEVFIDDAYTLAGFAIPNQAKTPAIQQECAVRGWDCDSETLHKLPGTQHINVDQYAQCGGGCSGNPYDQTWGLNPRGWGESHELGHNLQVNRLKVYGGRSGEISNQIFPLHKDWRVLREFGQNLDDTRVNYRNAYNLIVAGRAEADPLAGVYKRLWEDPGTYALNGERMAFYTQWVHYWADLKNDPLQGWDIWTLLYLHQRQVDKSDWDANKAALGYASYAQRPGNSGDASSTDGNDNLLIGLSWLTQRDQRPTFALWGIRTSAAAQAQVAAYGFAEQPAFFYANNRTNEYSTVKLLDMSQGSPAWPFP